MLKRALGSAVLISLLAGVLLGCAGTLAWHEAWIVLALLAAFVGISLAVLDPSLLAERSHVLPGVKKWDVKLATLGAALLYPGTLAVAGLDRRLGWSPGLGAGVEQAALSLFAAGYAVSFWAMKTNRFYSAFVRIQVERGHATVTDGPYRTVRHPGYAGLILAHLALPLGLDSVCAFGPALLGAWAFVARTAREDRTLQQELPGYRDYADRVKWRLAPGVW